MSDNTAPENDLETLRNRLHDYFLIDESDCVSKILQQINIPPLDLQKIEFHARDLVEVVRNQKKSQGGIEAFIHEYSLSSEEGIILMCLAEALLRIPDDATADRLIKNKLALAEFQSHQGNSHSLFVNASTWGLMLTGKIVNVGDEKSFPELFANLVGRIGEPMIRTILRQAMKLMASQYVMGRDIESAITRSQKNFHKNYRFSFDMLGESALSTKDAKHYFNSYKNAIENISSSSKGFENASAAGISIKLSALHPRYEVAQKQRVMTELREDLLELIQFAREKNVAVTLDAEEADRLSLSLDIFESIFFDESLERWNGLGLAVQAYQKRALPVLHWLNALAKKAGKIIPVRLVKGAYWDTEIKRAQEQGLSEFPVFTRKSSTDCSYIACAQFLLENNAQFFPQFATHNAHTLATILLLVDEKSNFEFQRLHGMGENLHDQLIEHHPCRIYSPVGSYEDLLPYLVRRLLENGANSSFVNRVEDKTISVEHIVKSPMEVLSHLTNYPNAKIHLPENLFSDRKNSKGLNLGDDIVLSKLANDIKQYFDRCWFEEEKNGQTSTNPACLSHIVGHASGDNADAVRESLERASNNQAQWQQVSIDEKIKAISCFSDLLEKNKIELFALCVYEAGKTIKDAVAEVREAIDFCEYYIFQSKRILINREKLPGPVGEENVLSYHGRGVFVCISPWNFPVAIFVGQIVAALLAGNTVIAKASSNTILIAKRIVELFYEAGLNEGILSLVNCRGRDVDQYLLQYDKVSGVAFTGSFDTALIINRALAQRNSPIVPLIAETGGMNAMIVDSSALPEQVVKDVISSAFLSAGQRCSALRVLIIQKDILERLTELLIDAMGELIIGDPGNYSTDIPPVIDEKSKQSLETYVERFREKNKCLHQLTIPNALRDVGNFVAPALLEINTLSDLDKEQFGPVLHLMSFESSELEQLIKDVNEMGYGLTLGIHSRIEETIEFISQKANVGNVYVNRNMVGAVVGVQPFGGEGYSGTGPKAGGPNYLQRFCTEKTVSTNTAAIGGNADLLSLSDDAEN